MTPVGNGHRVPHGAVFQHFATDRQIRWRCKSFPAFLCFVSKVNRYIACIVITAMGSCAPDRDSVSCLNTGIWRATVEIQGQELPFNLEVSRDAENGYDMQLINAEERLLLDEVVVDGDSVDIPLHIFDANIRARVQGDTLLEGFFIKNYEKDYRLPFRATYGKQHRFAVDDQNSEKSNFAGTYEVRFVNEGDTTPAIGLFRQEGNTVTGTFITPTGDYRFLEGNVSGPHLYLSTFDGNYSYLFKATMQQDGTIKGDFFSGKTRHETWTAVRNDQARLPNPDSLTHLRPGYDRITFAFPNVEGDSVSLDDPKYEGKVVILQLMGTWCPNCMDETRFLTSWYDANRDRGVEIIALAYERKADFAYASARVKKMAEKLNVNYEILIAGTDDKADAASTLPMLNAVIAFPTTIFVGKDGKVRKIHTGFTGPGTGPYYEEFKQTFNETVNALLKEAFTARR